MTTLFLVQGDTGPQVQVNLTRADTGSAVDCSGSTCTMKVRARGSDSTLFTLTAANSGTNFQNGILTFAFGNNLASIDAGTYEGEVNVVFSDGSIETVFEVVDFVVRDDFS
tara:strand:- start:862 stop:1194 length:333 start_codon:yes stop_codon:yes gene_type:complete